MKHFMKGLNLVLVRVWINKELSSQKNNYTSARVNEMKKRNIIFSVLAHQRLLAPWGCTYFVRGV